MATVATAYVQVMPSMEGATTNITNAILPQIDGAADAAGTSFGQRFGGKLSGSLAKFAGPAVFAATAVAAGKALFDIGERFDAMTDSIIIGTGESGEALDGLVQSAKNIATTVPTSFEEAGDVVQNLNTRLGITGENLDALGSRVLEAGNLMGEKMNLDTLTGALNTFGVANEDAAGKLDYLFNVGQATGIGLNDLTGTMEKQAPALKALGFSFEESANMIGILDKAGLDASSTVGRLTKVLQDSADKGIPARDAFNDIVKQMQDYLAVGDEVSALQLSEEIFGTRGAAQFLDAVKQGAVSLDSFADAALGAGDGIMGTMERTMDWQESWQLLQNSIMLALEPLASGIFEAISNSIAGMTAFVQQNQEAFNMLGQVLGTVAGVLINIVGGALTVIGGLIHGVAVTVNLLGGVFQNLVGTVTGVFDRVKGIVSGAVDFLKGLFHFEFRLPDLKLPHIIVGGYIDVPVLGRIPNPTTLRVDWYATGGIVDGPTLIGAGEAGPEAIVPLTAPNLAPFADAVASRIDGGGVTINGPITVVADDPEQFMRAMTAYAARARRQYA